MAAPGGEGSRWPSVEERGADGPGKRGGRLRDSLGGGHAPRYGRSGCQSEAALHSLGLAVGWKELASYCPLSSASPTQSLGTLRPHWLPQASQNISLGLAY